MGLAHAPGGVRLESVWPEENPGLASIVRLESFMDTIRMAAIIAMQAVRNIRFSFADMVLDFFLRGRRPLWPAISTMSASSLCSTVLFSEEG